jgi:hypothetical protein
METCDSGLDTFSQFTELLSKPPKPANLLLFMNERFPKAASVFQLDENMQNAHLSRDTIDLAVHHTIVPLCRNVCKRLQPMGHFY